jgi:sugar transferase (PEP-CTERM/EpsH1 system associated)
MKLFVILSRVPFPLVKGDKLRAYHQLKELKKRHEIILCCLTDENPSEESINRLSEISDRHYVFKLKKLNIYLNLILGILSHKPFQVLYFYQRSIHKKIKSLIDEHRPNHIYCQLIRTAEYAKNEHAYHKTLDYQDAFSKGIDRREKRAMWPIKEVFSMEKRRLIAYENVVFEYFEQKTIISEEDRRFIYNPGRRNIKIVTNGIDTEFFAPMAAKKEYDLVFTGNMSYPPNVRTAIFIATEIFPELRKRGIVKTLLLAGASPTKKVQQLDKIEGVTVTGWMDDIRMAYASSRIFFAPMQIGTGLQNKLLEAMAMEIPCITSSLANRSLKAIHNEHILVGDDMESYFKEIEILMTDASLHARLSKAGRKFVEHNFSWAESVRVLESCFEAQKSISSV